MEEAFSIARKNSTKSGNYNKEYYDRKVKEVEIVVGDHVLVRNMRERGGTGKLRNHWESEIFEVEEKKENLPVYSVRNLNNKKDVRSLHRNLIMRVNELPSELFQKETMKKISKCQAKEKPAI